MLNIKETADNVKVTAKEVNKKALKVSNEIVDETLAAGEKWQKVFAKAVTTGVTIFGHQQEVALTALEGAREHYIAGSKRFRKLFGLQNVNVTETAKKATKKVVKKAEKATAETAKEVAKVKKEVVKAKKEVVKKAEKVIAKTPKTTATNDLKVVNGIGPKMEKVLNSFGIKTYADLAKADAAKLKDQLVAENARYAMYEPKEWIAAAKKLAK